MSAEDERTTVPTEPPTGHEAPERAPGEPAGADERHPVGPAPVTRRQHARFAIGLAFFLLILGWLSFDGAHPDIALLVYLAVLGVVYRIAATHHSLSRRGRENAVFIVLTLGLLGLLGMLSGWSNTYLVFILTTIIIYAIFSLGLNLEFGYTGIINFGHVAFMGIGAYTMALLSVPLLEHTPALTRPGAPGLLVLAVTALLVFVFAGVLLSVFIERSTWTRRAAPATRRRTIVTLSTTGALLLALLVVLIIPYPLTPLWATTAIIVGSAIAGMILAALAGAVLGLPSLRLRTDYLAIVTIGAAEILRRFWRNERELTGGPTGIAQLPQPFAAAGREWSWLGAAAEWLDVRDPNRLLLLLIALALLLVVVAVFWILLRSPYGRVLRSIREDEEVATALGKNVFLYKLQVLAIGSMVAALAGSLLAWHRLFISPETFIPLITFYAWIIIVMGGVGNNKGTLLGAVILFTFFEATRSLNLDQNLGLTGPQGSAFRIVLIGLLLVVLMLFRPEGILGRREEMVLGD